MEIAAAVSDNPVAMSTDLAPLLDRIRLLAEEPLDSPERLLERMEHTLTDGYALALALEGESIRIEKEIDATVLRIKAGEASSGLDALGERLASNERELRALRAHLASLRIRAEGVRAASLAPRSEAAVG
jgi:type II secretory pathway component PulF